MIVDSHHDLLVELWLRDHEPNPFGGELLGHLRAGNVAVQVCSIGSDDAAFPGGALEQVLHQAAAFHKACRTNPAETLMVRTAADLDTAVESGRLGMILALEGADAIGRSLGLADLMIDIGVRMVGVTWEQRNAIADGTGERSGAGLSEFGREFIGRMIERGVILDLAHASVRTFNEIIEAAGADGGSVLCSHAGCARLHDIPRNLTDKQLRTLAAAGGVVGIPAVPGLLHGNDRSIQRMIDHIVHAMGVAGAENVGIGSDFMTRLMRSKLFTIPRYIIDRVPPDVEIGAPIDELHGPEHFDRLAEALSGRGLSDHEVDGVLHGNLMRFFKGALPGAQGQA